MLSKSIEKAMNEQIKWEFFSGYMYLSMATYFHELGLTGFAIWMENQYEEEVFHALKMYKYVTEAGGRVKMQAIDQPQHDWKSALDCMEYSLKHENMVTKRINDLASLAQDERDHATFIFLQWYVSEQVEEEANFGDVVNKLKLVGDGGGLFMLDRELGARTFVRPAPGA
ncbi:MAG: ferritin [Proteobacteria bacterium]|nr:ferritin [Pseudomonadota bacterium]MBU1611805.1 ferritin [Pseudomonadota bacterium]